jgi:hypothetical protein
MTGASRPSPDGFAEIVRAYQSNEYLLGQVARADRQIAQVREYLAAPGCNPALGAARLRVAKARRTAALTILRANRIRARALIARSA